VQDNLVKPTGYFFKGKIQQPK